jgi:hypothetical protein
MFEILANWKVVRAATSFNLCELAVDMLRAGGTEMAQIQFAMNSWAIQETRDDDV